MAIEINFYDQVIYVTSPTTTVTVQEVYDAIRAAEDSVEGMAFDGLIIESAVFDLGGGAYTAVSMELNSNWYLEFYDGVVLGTVKEGNLVGGDSNRPVRAATGSTDTAYQLGAQYGIQFAVGSGLTSEQATQLEELHQIQGLEDGTPMTVTPTSRSAGDISQTISGDGENTSTVTRN